MHNDQIVSLLKTSDGLSDREITNALFGRDQPQQTVNQVCRNLANRGVVIKRKRPDSIIGNYLADENCLCLPMKAKKPKTEFVVEIPNDLRQKARELGKMWAESSHRPRLGAEIKEVWDQLIESWISDPDLPLVIRKGGIRGAAVLRKSNGREIVIADNSPAQWVFTCALDKKTYDIKTLKENIDNHKVPFAFATKTSEKSKMKYRRTVISCRVDLNKRGWKLCHIESVGLNDKTLVEDLPIERLKEHTRLLLSPSNHFVVPKQWAGFGEIQEVIDEVREFEETHL